MKKMIKLNQLVMKFVPLNYLKYLKDNMDTKIAVNPLKKNLLIFNRKSLIRI